MESISQKLFSNCSPSNDHELHITGSFANPLPDIDGEDGGGAVEDGREVGDERSDHDRQHESFRSGGHEVEHQGGVGDVRAATFLVADLFARCRLVATNSVCRSRG